MESNNSGIQPSSRKPSRSESDDVKGESAGHVEPTKQKVDDLQKLKDENQALKNHINAQQTEIEFLKSQLQTALESLADLQQQLRVSDKQVGLDLTSLSGDEPAPAPDKCQSFAPNLPAEILCKIFKTTDTSSLLTCRAVCPSWRTVIDNTPAFMQRFTFLVTHPRFFLDLTNIVPVVRSIKFQRILPCTEDELQNLFSAIGPTLQSVAFHFDSQPNSALIKPQQRRIVSLVLRACPQLAELRLLSTWQDFIVIHLSNNEPMFEHITSLTMNVFNVTNEDTVFQELIMNLPKLSTLTLFLHGKCDNNFDDRVVNASIPRVVCAHISKYPGILKKLGYKTGDDPALIYLDSSWTKLFLLAGKYDVIVTTDRPFDLINLCVFGQTHEYPINLKTCSAIKNVMVSHLVLSADNFHRIFFCLNVERAVFKISDDIRIGMPELDDLRQFTKLHQLTLAGFYRFGVLLELRFAHIYLDVSSLSIEKVNIESVTSSFSTLHVYLPNLVDLRLYLTSVPENLFISLGRLGRLSALELRNLNGLTDRMFLLPEANSGISAIATLKKLKELTLWECRYLTDNCLFNGILLCPTLEKLSVLGYGDGEGFTEVGYNAITDGRLKKRRIAKQTEDPGLTFTLP